MERQCIFGILVGVAIIFCVDILFIYPRLEELDIDDIGVAVHIDFNNVSVQCKQDASGYFSVGGGFSIGDANDFRINGVIIRGKYYGYDPRQWEKYKDPNYYETLTKEK